jgi:hypothetical protein
LQAYAIGDYDIKEEEEEEEEEEVDDEDATAAEVVAPMSKLEQQLRSEERVVLTSTQMAESNIPHILSYRSTNTGTFFFNIQKGMVIFENIHELEARSLGVTREMIREFVMKYPKATKRRTRRCGTTSNRS